MKSIHTLREHGAEMFYKLVFNNLGVFQSLTTNGAALVTYRLGKTSKTPPWLAKLKNYLFAFDSLDAALAHQNKYKFYCAILEGTGVPANTFFWTEMEYNELCEGIIPPTGRVQYSAYEPGMVFLKEFTPIRIVGEFE